MGSITLLLSAASGHDEHARILLAFAFVLVGAKLFGALVERLGQPAVLGELLFGIALGTSRSSAGPASLRSRPARPSRSWPSSAPSCCSSRSASSPPPRT